MKTQKIICLFLCALMLFAICGCSDKGDNSNNSNNSSSTTNAGSNGVNSSTGTASDGDTQDNSSQPTASNNDSQNSSNDSQISGNTSGNNSSNASSNTSSNTSSNNSGNTSKPVGQTCSHKNTTVKNKTAATCTKAGYSGDTYCKDCNKKLSSGSAITATGHKNTELRNYKDASYTSAGYTGDTYCKDCGTKIATGKTIPKWESVYEKRARTMAAASKKVSHQFADVEKEILRLVNVERQKAGLKAVEWYEDPYCFVKIRTEESLVSFSHTRLNGKNWYTIYEDAKVELHKASENLAYAENYSVNKVAQLFMDSWMKSAGHKANILDPNVTLLSVAVVQEGNKIGAVQHFFD